MERASRGSAGERERGVGKLALGTVNKVKVENFGFFEKLGLILFLPGASQNE